MAVLTPHWILDVALIFASVLVTVYLYMTRNFNYWKNRGVTEKPPIPFFGNFFDCCLFRISPSSYIESLYKEGKGLPYFGFYAFNKPALLLRDPDIIKSVLIKDFNCFADRYLSTDKSDTIASANMFVMKNPHWKTVRNKMTPIFTTAKLKTMFGLMLEIGNDLATHLEACRLQGDGRVIEMKDLSAKYTTDVITSCAFGLQVNSLLDPEAAFRKCGIKIFGFTSYMRSAEFAMCFFAPKMVNLLKLKFFSKEASDFLRNVFTKTMALRMESKTTRNDLIDMLIQMKESKDQSEDPNDFKFDGDNLVGQAATFFAAGFETSATTMAFSLYELALQPDIQSRLREEIISALEESGGEITYEMVVNLPYLDMVVSETLRKYPTLPILDRVPLRDYKVSGTDLVIEKGTPVYVSLFGLHYDPEYFPDPEKYDPERFSKENRQKLPSCVYMPFGEGPRNCIGLRFGLLLSKLGVLKFILDYEVTACPQTLIPMRFDQKAISILPEGGIFLNVRSLATHPKY